MSEPAKSATSVPISGLPGRHGKIGTEKPKNSKQVILRLWLYVKQEKALLLVIAALLLINTATTLAGSYLLRPIINQYILPHNIPGLIKMIFVLLAIYITGAVAAIWQNRLMIKVAQKIINIIRADLFGKIQSLPVKFFDTNSHGELMSRFTNDVDNVSDALNTSISQLFTSAITLTGIFVLMIYISPWLTLVTLVIVPLMLWVASQIIKKSKTFFYHAAGGTWRRKWLCGRNDYRAKSSKGFLL